MISTSDRYLDTPDGALRSAGLAARLRTSSEAMAPRITVKSLAREGAGAVHRRLELEAPLAAPLEAPLAASPAAADGEPFDPAGWPASAARDAIIGASGGNRLEVIATIRQARFQRDVRIGASRVELSLDTIEARRADGTGDHWVELEAELLDGTTGDLEALGRRLAAHADLAPATSGKLDRALGRMSGRPG